MPNCCHSERSSSYSTRVMLILSTHSARPHSQRRSSWSSRRLNVSATCWMRSFTSRKTASLSPILSSRVVMTCTLRLCERGVLFNERVGGLAVSDGSERTFGVGVVRQREEVRRVRAHARVLRESKRHELRAIL